MSPLDEIEDDGVLLSDEGSTNVCKGERGTHILMRATAATAAAGGEGGTEATADATADDGAVDLGDSNGCSSLCCGDVNGLGGV